MIVDNALNERAAQAARAASDLPTLVFRLLNASDTEKALYARAIFLKHELILDRAVRDERKACHEIAVSCPESQGDPPAHVAVQLIRRSIIDCVRGACQETKLRIAERILGRGAL